MTDLTRLASRLRTLLAGARPGPWHGPPPALPDGLDRLADRWFRLPPRLRLAAGAAAAFVVLSIAGAGAARSPWGAPVEVLVATHDLAVGASLAPGDVETARRPQGLVPPDAVTTGDVTGGPTLAATVIGGTIVTRRHLAGPDGLTADLADGRAAFPIEAGPLVSATPGQRVDVVAGDVDGRGRTLATDARVLTVVGDVVWLDVARGDAPGLAAAATWDGLRLVLLSGG